WRGGWGKPHSSTMNGVPVPTLQIGMHGDREDVIRAYRRWLWGRILEQGDVYAELKRLAELAKQGDLTLVCRRHPSPCHGSIVKRSIEWLNSDQSAAFNGDHADGISLSDNTVALTNS
ncbi:MAG TPA: DUF4326 domain-containing protein, partial [Blastocatellia bacterium]|nr:DUF4326 domain-containing protein [Blastocatellia bacterium]